jgi:hypothetical protein
MTTNFDDLFGSWLEDGPTRAADRVIESIRADVARTPQRRPSILRPRIGSARPRPLQFGVLAAAAIAVVALVSMSILVVRGPGIGTLPTASPSSSPSPGPSIVGERLRNDRFRVPFSVTLPDGWNVVDDSPTSFVALRPVEGVEDTPQAGIDVVIVDNVVEDPCNSDSPLRDPPRDSPLRDPPLGPSARELADWLASFDRLSATQPVQVTLGGRPAWRVDESFIGDIECQSLTLWKASTGYVGFDEIKHYHVLEVDGQRVVAVSVSQEFGNEASEAEAAAVLQTIVFE